MPALTLPVLTATRYAVPLREGGSLPAVVETDGGLFVAKFRGAGQGARALIAELIAGMLARHLGLPVPEPALIHLDASFGRSERDPEIQDILKGSTGLNVGLRYLDGAFNYEPVAAADLVPDGLAAAIVWFDAFITNLDRTPRNPNLLLWDRRLWLIDHGAALYFHHNWDTVTPERARQPFPLIREHVLLPLADGLNEAHDRLHARLDAPVLRAVLDAVPDALLMDALPGRPPPFPTAAANRDAYHAYLTERLAAMETIVAAAQQTRAEVLNQPRQSLSYRR